MKKNLVCFAVATGLIVSLFGTSSLALAQDLSGKSASDSSIKAVGSVKDTLKAQLEAQKVRLKEVRKNIEEKVKNKKEEVKKKLETGKAEKVRKQAEKIINRYDAATNRLDNIAARVGARLDKFEQAGKDVSKNKSALNSAKTKIEEARAKFAEMKTGLESVYSSETPKTELDNSKTKIEELKTVLFEAQSALVDVINSIKGESNK